MAVVNKAGNEHAVVLNLPLVVKPARDHRQILKRVQRQRHVQVKERYSKNELCQIGMCILRRSLSGLDFITKDLPSVLIQIIADQLLNDSLFCSYTYNEHYSRLSIILWFLLLTFLIKLSELCISLQEILCNKLKLD